MNKNPKLNSCNIIEGIHELEDATSGGFSWEAPERSALKDKGQGLTDNWPAFRTATYPIRNTKFSYKGGLKNSNAFSIM